MKTFNGKYSCCTCEDPGDNTLGRTRLHRVWPYTDNCTIRTPERVEDAYRSTCSTGNAVSYILLPYPAADPNLELLILLLFVGNGL